MWNEITYPFLKFKRSSRWSLEMDKWFHPTLYWKCDYLSMLGSNLNHVSKSGPSYLRMVINASDSGGRNGNTYFTQGWVQQSWLEQRKSHIYIQPCHKKSCRNYINMAFWILCRGLTQFICHPVTEKYRDFCLFPLVQAKVCTQPWWLNLCFHVLTPALLVLLTEPIARNAPLYIVTFSSTMLICAWSGRWKSG